MTSTEKKIAFKIEFTRVLELFADQIYQSPLALLRENTQNAFDAIRMRAISDENFTPRIEVTVDSEAIVVRDNGIGMTAEEIESNFWYAGKSGKNTPEARAAGVVGTFGIGAMANFGVADVLSVDSESVATGERTLSSVHKSDLSTEMETISVVSLPSTGNPGTTVRAQLASTSTVSVLEARQYLRQFVEFVDVPVLFNNDDILSGSNHRAALPSERYSWIATKDNISIDGGITGNLEVHGMASGELRVIVENVISDNHPGRPGAIVLVQGRNSIRTLRSGFGLATVGMGTPYQWGGVADLAFLKPTAGREALDVGSSQQLQKIVSSLDRIVSLIAADHHESFMNDDFLQWIRRSQQYNLCGQLEVTPRPSGQPEVLERLIERPGLRYYGGRDETIISTYASEEHPLIVLSRRSPRRDCELGYLSAHHVHEVDDSPTVTSEIPPINQTLSQTALGIRVSRILEEDYFLPADIRYGSITNELPLLVTDTKGPVTIVLNPTSTSVGPLLVLYENDYDAFIPFTKDFVRNEIFPRVSKLVPSSTKVGAEAFLRHLRSSRELFEYELQDKANLEEIFKELHAGRLNLVEATRRLAEIERSIIEVSSAGTAPLSSVVREVSDDSQEDPNSLEPRPSIDRREVETNALILTSDDPLNGYSCFLSLSDRVQSERGEFFLQPHSTEVVWGGRKVIFIFHHHSRRYGLYYDILCPELVGTSAGGHQGMTSTILTKGRTFIPIPEQIVADFIPIQGERKRLEVRGEVLYLGTRDDEAVGFRGSLGT